MFCIKSQKNALEKTFHISFFLHDYQLDVSRRQHSEYSNIEHLRGFGSVYTRHISLEPLCGNHSTVTLMHALQNIFNRFGKPTLIISDAALEFLAAARHLKKFTEFLEKIILGKK